MTCLLYAHEQYLIRDLEVTISSSMDEVAFRSSKILREFVISMENVQHIFHLHYVSIVILLCKND